MSILPKRLHAPALLAAGLCLMLAARAQVGAHTPATAGPSNTQNPAIVPADRLNVDWWAARHQAIVSELPQHSDAQLLLIGDSITNNYDKAEPPNQNFQPIWQQYYAPRSEEHTSELQS